MKLNVRLPRFLFMNVLVVGERREFRRAARLALEDLGFDVVESVGEDDAISAILHHSIKFDLALIDLDSPEIDGSRLLSAIQKFNPWIHFIVFGKCEGQETHQILLPESEFVTRLSIPIHF